MQYLDLTLPTPEENLALDEALLLSAEDCPAPQDVLRIWESPTTVVVVGRASRIRQEVNVAACEAQGVPILRRHSGGATIVAGRGCLMYAVVLNYQSRPRLQMIDEAHRFVLDTLVSGLSPFLKQVERAGTCDLALDGQMKFSGNALRCCRSNVLYHGTLMYDFPVDRVGELLLQPPRQPDYRKQRGHAEFVINVPLSAEQLRDALISAWTIANNDQRLTALVDWPAKLTAQLAAERYGSRDWNWQR